MVSADLFFAIGILDICFECQLTVIFGRAFLAVSYAFCHCLCSASVSSLRASRRTVDPRGFSAGVVFTGADGCALSDLRFNC